MLVAAPRRDATQTTTLAAPTITSSRSARPESGVIPSVRVLATFTPPSTGATANTTPAIPKMADGRTPDPETPAVSSAPPSLHPFTTANPVAAEQATTVPIIERPRQESE